MNDASEPKKLHIPLGLGVGVVVFLIMLVIADIIVIEVVYNKGGGTSNTPAEAPRNLMNVYDYQQAAVKILPKANYDFTCGTRDEITLTENVLAYQRIQLRPRVLRNASYVDTTLTIFNRKLPFPIVVAPFAFQKWFHPEGEMATAKGAKDAGTTMVLSSNSFISMTEIATVAPGWIQLYVFKNRTVNEGYLRRAEQLGYGAVFVTVDFVDGTSRLDRFSGNQQLPSYPSPPGSYAGIPSKDMQFDNSLTWDIIEWLRSATKLPIVLKGIQTPEDALIAIEKGVDAIVVSNHGGQVQDTAPATIEMLPSIAQAVNGKIPIIIDGGIRRGTDVLKALALGAKFVMVGRPVLWGLAVNASEGVKTVLEMLGTEFQDAMRLNGLHSLAEINKTAINLDPRIFTPSFTQKPFYY